MLFLPALFRKFQRDNALFLARGLAFDVILCLIPAAFLLFLLGGFLFESPRQTIKVISPYLKSFIPFSRQQLLLNLYAVTKNQQVLGLLGLIGLLWTSSRVFGSIRTVLDTVFQVKSGRGLIAGKLFDLKMMLLSGLFLLATVLITFLFSFLKKASSTLGWKFAYLGFQGEVISVLLAFLFTAAMFFCLYKFIPYRRIHTETALFAALGASLLWEIAKHGFRFYLLHVAALNQIFGSFGLLLALMFWVYYSCIIFLLGAEMGWIWENRRGKWMG